MPSRAPDPTVVSLGGDVTEIIYALGMGDHVVGADASSTYPASVLDKPRLNYHRQTSAESVLSLSPDIILLTEEAGPPAAVEQLKEAGKKVVLIPNKESTDGVTEKIRAIAAALDRSEEGQKLIEQYEAELEAALAEVRKERGRPAVLFLYARQGMGAPMVGGGDSGASTMIELAGGQNAAEEMQGYKALTPEALLEFAPSCILMMEKGYEAIGGADGLLQIPGMRETPAGKSRNFVTLPDDILLSFGPRTPQAIRQLSDAFHSESALEEGT